MRGNIAAVKRGSAKFASVFLMPSRSPFLKRQHARFSFEFMKKISIRIRPVQEPAQPGSEIRLHEKELFFCTGCKNKYYSFQPLCPQCLNAVRSNHPAQTRL